MITGVYTSSFRDDDFDPRGAASFNLFRKERDDLLFDLECLPRDSVMRKINNLITRARLCKVHTLVLNHIKATLPSSKKKADAAQAEIFADLDGTFAAVARANSIAGAELSLGDFPDKKLFTETFRQFDFSSYEIVDVKLIQVVDELLVKELPALMKLLPTEAETRASRMGPAECALSADVSVQIDGKGDFIPCMLSIEAGLLQLSGAGDLTLKLMNFVLKMMIYVLKLMDLVLKMMNFVPNLMNLQRSALPHSQAAHALLRSRCGKATSTLPDSTSRKEIRRAGRSSSFLQRAQKILNG